MKRSMIFIVLFLIVLSTACANDIPADDPLQGEWYIAKGTPHDTVKEAEGYQYNVIENLSGFEMLHEDREGFVWVKKDFIYPGNKASERIGLLLGRIDMADETYLNGYLIGKEGRFPGNFFSVWNEYRFYYVPSEIINYNINNTLLIKIYCNYEGAIFGKKAIGRYEEIKLIYSSENFYSKTGNVVVAIMLFMIGLLHLIIYLKRKKDRENLYYSLVCLIFSIYLTNYFAVDIPGLYNSGISYLTFQKLIFSLINLIPLFIILFIHEFINKKIRKLFLIILLLASLIPTVVFIFSPTYEFFAQVKNILQAFLLIPLIYIAVLLIISLFRKNTEVRILILGLSPLFFCNLYDLVIVQFLKTQGVIYLSGIGFPAFIFAMAAILTTRFVHDRNEAEELNISLESKVKERTRQLSDAKDEIQAANEELEAMNDNLVLTNGELEEAQRIYKLDMKMAANVQVNIFNKEIPSFKDWDIAFEFIPMSGVSGDLYDFYYKADNLSGVSIFDVSGHGIASGLITLLAKSIIHRNYNLIETADLSAVMRKINADLTSEIAGSGYYLTGIILRTNRDLVEYVNAGHTELILKKTNDESVIVKPSDFDNKGLFLGIEDMKSDYPAYSFNCNLGDILVLYTDCLIEEKSNSGEPFGIERLFSAINKCGSNLSSKSVVSNIMNEFYEYTGRKNFSDDLTVIALKKL